jgi:hypothetical protein
MNLAAKLRFASALAGFALVVSVPAIAQAASYAGAWAITGRMGNPLVETIAPVCVFRQAGNTITGSCQGPAGIGSVTGGGVNGNRITWRWNRIATSTAQRSSVVTFFGVLGPAGIAGTWTDSAARGLVGAFSARRR